MKSSFYKILFALSLVITFSCKKEQGCTDSKATNYKTSAEEDDGSCAYERDKFLGSYIVNDSCFVTASGYTMSISPSPSRGDYVIIKNLDNWGPDIEAIVLGEVIRYSSGVGGFTWNYSGDATIDGNTLTLSSLIVHGNYGDSCVATATRL